MAIRRFNYTQRQRLLHADVGVALSDVAGRPSFSLELNLAPYHLPSDAVVAVEAYRQTEVRRFDFGSVADPRPRGALDLSGLTDVDSLLFRVKVVDRGEKPGRLLAEASGLRPEQGQRGETRSFLLVRQASLNGELWQVIVENEQPVLVLEEQYGPKELLLHSPHFRWLVLPAVMRELLRKATADGIPDEEDATDWRGKLLSVATELAGAPPPEQEVAEDDLEEWVTSVVRAFCRRHRLAQHHKEDLFGGPAN